LVLRSVDPSGPQLLFTGSGDPATLAVEQGFAFGFGPDPVPFRDASFSLARAP
jgi:hypothetical protein